jgi:hypothetical protein
MAIVAAIVVALIAGAFTLLGSRLTGKGATDQWLRDQRLSAYAAFVAAADEAGARSASHRAKRVAMSYDEMVAATRAFAAHDGRIVLLGPESVLSSMYEFRDHMFDGIRAAYDLEHPWDAARSGHLRAEFIKEARTAVGSAS